MTNAAKWLVCALLVVACVFNVASFYAVASIGESFALPALVAALALCLPTVLALGWLLFRPGKGAVGLAAGLGLVGALGAFSLGSLGYLGAWNPGDAERVSKTIAFLVAPNLVLAVVAVIIGLRAFGSSAIGAVAVGSGAALFLDAAAAALGVIGMTGVNLSANLQWGGQLTRLEHVLNRVTACAFQYAEHSADGGYPPSLAAMGTGGTGCIDAASERQAAKLAVVYEPERTTAPIRAFRLTGFAKAADGDHIRGGADTNGFVMTHTGEHEVRIGPRGLELAVMRMVSMRNCALLARHLGSTGAFPRTVQELRALSEPAGDALRLGCQNYSIEGADSNSYVYDGRRFTYRVDAAGQTFAIESRPVEYGAGGVNSYLLRDEGGVHVTHSNRAATPSDAAIPACTYPDSSWQNTAPSRCVQLARPRVDLPVRLLRPLAVRPSDEFRIAVDTLARLPVGLSFGIACGATPSNMQYETMPRLRARPIEICSTSRWPVGTPYVVMLFMRDSLGGIGWSLDSIAVR